MTRYTRRQFLALTGLSTIAGSVACAAGAASYALLQYPGRVDGRRGVPTPSPTRPAHLKQIARPPIVTRAQWGARVPNHNAPNESSTYSLDNVNGWREYVRDLRDVYRTVIVHHSVEYENNDLITVREIQAMHMDERGWADIAYHYLVGRSGQIFEGRPLAVRGTHVSHYNTGSVGVCFLGSLHIVQPTEAQLQQGRELINWLALRLELTHLAGHYEFNPESICPGQHMIPHLEGFAASAGLVLGTGGYVPPLEQRITPTAIPPGT